MNICGKIATFAKPRNVTGHAKRQQCKQKTTKKMNRKANPSAKSKEVQRYPQASAQLHHICFCPNRTMRTIDK